MSRFRRALLALSLTALITTIASAATTSGPPYYTRPADPGSDLALLQRQHASGRADEAWWLQRIALYTAIGELDTIAPLVEQLQQIWPRQPVFREAQMILLSGHGEHQNAVQIGEAVLAEFPEHPSIRVNLARVQQAAGNQVAAMNLLIAAIERGPVRVQDWNFLLRALTRTDATAAGMLDRLQRKSEQNPELKGLKYLRVILHARLGQHDAARALLLTHPELAAHPELQRYVLDVAAALPASAHRAPTP
jgi:tetratricopeptide (TPR) repeat protein